MSSIVGSAIEATASNINTGVNNLYNQKLTRETNKANILMNRETNETNLKLAREQNDWNLAQWNRENDYNSPLAQSRRLRQAGLSQAAAAASVNGNVASPLQSADLANQVAPPPLEKTPLDLQLPSILGIMRSVEQYRKEKEEANQAEVKTETDKENLKWLPDFLLTQYDKERADVNLKQQEYLNTFQSFPYSLRALKYKADADSKLPALRNLEVERLRAENAQIDMNVRLARQQFGFLEKMNEQEINKMVEEVRNVVKQGKVLDSQVDLNRAQEDVAKKTKEGLSFDNEVKEISAIFAKHGQPESVAQKAGVLIAEGKLNVDVLDKALEGTKDYVEHGHKCFGVSPFARDFLYYMFDEGSASKLTLSPKQQLFNNFGKSPAPIGKDSPLAPLWHKK